ncbi:MAG: hypothetical protein ACRDTA_21455 [Pseudonocardiaceae bacterium]
MGESYWERKQRHLNDDHEARRKQSKRTMGLLKAQENIEQLTGHIEAATASSDEWTSSDEFRRLGVEWMLKKSSTIVEISNDPYLSADLKTVWCRTLKETTLTHPDEDDLISVWAGVLLEVFKFDLRPGRVLSLTALASSITALIELRAGARAEM